jgi:hypothetical protein
MPRPADGGDAFDDWTETLGSGCLTGTLVGRLSRHVTILEMNGGSSRLVQIRAQRAAAKP